MRCLLDTNIVLRYVNKDAAEHPEVRRSVIALVTRGDDIYIAPQCLYEAWAVMTRPKAANGLGWSPDEVRVIVDDILEDWIVLPDPPELFETWLDLVTTQQVSGKPTHDARLAAAARVHQLDALLTLNPDHFKRFGVPVLTPADL